MTRITRITVLFIILLFIGNVCAEEDTPNITRIDFVHRISNDTINESVDEFGETTISTNESNDIDDVENLENVENRSSPGFESVIVVVIFVLMVIGRIMKGYKM